MQTAASNSLVLTDSSSLKRFADFETAISHAGFYQQIAARLLGGVHTERAFREIGDRLVVAAEHAHAFRHMNILEEISGILTTTALPRDYQIIGQYYQALCIQSFGRGDLKRAMSLFERVAELAPSTYQGRALISLGANSRNSGDNHSAVSFYSDAIRFISLSGVNDPYSAIHSQKMIAVIGGEDGHHRNAVALLENLFPLARSLRSTQPHVYYDYLNSLAVELCEVGRLEEARNASQIVIGSRFASAYPEWHDTHDDIKVKGLRASRSIIALSTIVDASLSQPTAETSVRPEPFEGGNLVRLPLVDRSERLDAAERPSVSQPARVFSIQAWKEKIARQQNHDPSNRRPRPTASAEKAARLEELEKLTSREVLMKIMDNLGDERVGEEPLRRALIILENLEPDENHGA